MQTQGKLLRFKKRKEKNSHSPIESVLRCLDGAALAMNAILRIDLQLHAAICSIIWNVPLSHALSLSAIYIILYLLITLSGLVSSKRTSQKRIKVSQTSKTIIGTLAL